MQISISGKNVDTGAAFQEHGSRALDHAVNKYFSNAISGVITLIKGAAGFDVRIRVNLTRRIEMEASGTASDAHQALDIAIEHIEKRLRRYKRRLRNHHNRTSEEDAVMPATLTLLATEQEAEETLPEQAALPVIAEMDYAVHLYSVEEAIMHFELSGQTALLFRNASHMGLNMLHRRDDGTIGWIDPRGNRSTA